MTRRLDTFKTEVSAKAPVYTESSKAGSRKGTKLNVARSCCVELIFASPH